MTTNASMSFDTMVATDPFAKPNSLANSDRPRRATSFVESQIGSDVEYVAGVGSDRGIAHTMALEYRKSLHDQFAERLFRLLAKDERKAVDAVYTYLDDLLLAGKMPECDRAVSVMDLNRMPPSVIISVLIATKRARRHGLLPSSTELLRRAEVALSASYSEQQAAILVERYK